MIAAMSDNPLELVKAYVASGIFPGASFAIVNGQAIEKYVIGYECLRPEPVLLQTDMSYDLASVSKVVGTGTVMIDLVLSGQVELDALLIDYYPDFKGPGSTTLTIRQLLTHTSGIDPFIENRHNLAYDELRAALNQVTVTSDKTFHYTDVNFILLGFMLEEIYGQDLADILQDRVFKPFNMHHTSFVAPDKTVATAWNLPKGLVHDPKAQVLGRHTGSAGLFSDLDDLIAFSQAYFANPVYLLLLKDYAKANKARSLAWDLVGLETSAESSKKQVGQWLLHTGYTGTFILLNLKTQQAVIFLSNRVHLRDERKQWIADRNVLIQAFLKMMKIIS
ncbi:CubicO group peptidase, beta-lactamase class C family [Lactococcus chungangensis CAU 28 = DSM 22330]|uniref:CubicO group peptidase, beta-lactamase class C family n=2 Tax=Pseudolactococcus chungangensis CAU 28 = DSM 22330 TaxID=1122154 RepID=A0A1K2H6V3_9LACT|nr:serine hydrolase domain-containing protein [Lactococcus chungangensis]NCB80848.1 class A beta-lactamase-related serine hydrolase [Bacilli bacterium]SFZ71351.1 CubicO group peptidase, beta-lactamase class C family [Lactococcus chungangensis CAU 28 = DSM 22330]